MHILDWNMRINNVVASLFQGCSFIVPFLKSLLQLKGVLFEARSALNWVKYHGNLTSPGISANFAQNK